MANFTLKQSDALIALQNISTPKAETIVLTDPPYGIDKNWRYEGEFKDPDLGEEYRKQFCHWSHVKTSGCFVFCDIRQLAMWESCFDSVGFKHVRIGVWVKPNAYWNPSPYSASSLEGFVWACNDRTVFNVRSTIPAYKCSYGGHYKDGEERHPFRKPVPLVRQIIRDLDACGKTIVDPFAGGGSIPVGALLESCHVLVSDIDAATLPNLDWRLENYYMWETSVPKEDIKMTDDNNTDPKPKPKKRRKRSGYTDTERLKIIKVLAEATELKNSGGGMREYDFLATLLGPDFNKSAKDMKGAKRKYGKLERRISVSDLWKECRAIAKEAKAQGVELHIPQMSAAERKSSDIRRVLYQSGLLKRQPKSKNDQMGLIND
jgi:hypothetical protein